MSKSSPTTSEAERNTDDEPNTEDYKHGSEGHRTARRLCPKKEVEKEEGSEDDSRYHNGRQSNVLLPLFAAKRLIDTC